MRHESIFELNKLADEYEAKAKAYRAVANDLMNGTGFESSTPKTLDQTGRKYNGTHWMQKPENRAKMMKNVRRMHRARKASK